MMSSNAKLASAAWVAFVVGVFAWTWWSYVNAPVDTLAREVLFRHGLVMLTVSAPVGLALAAAGHFSMRAMGVELVGLDDAVFMSVVCGVGGWLQWVVLFPWAVKTLKRRFTSSRH